MDIDEKLLRLEEDLGIYGDEAEEFMDKYCSMFDVNISQLDLDIYFRHESTISFLYKLFHLYKFFPKFGKKRYTITVGDLQKGIITKRLDNVMIHGADSI